MFLDQDLARVFRRAFERPAYRSRIAQPGSDTGAAIEVGRLDHHRVAQAFCHAYLVRRLADLGDRVITAYRPGSVPAGEGASVRVLVGSGVAEVVSSTGGGSSSGAALPFSMAAGAVTLSFSGAPASASVTFPAGRFTQPPVVTATLGVASLGISLSATSVTATGCTIGGSSSYTGSVPVQWVAVQMTSTSGTG